MNRFKQVVDDVLMFHNFKSFIVFWTASMLVGVVMVPFQFVAMQLPVPPPYAATVAVFTLWGFNVAAILIAFVVVALPRAIIVSMVAEARRWKQLMAARRQKAQPQ